MAVVFVANSLVIALVTWVYFYFGSAAALRHFDLHCPRCHERGGPADFLFRKARCRPCDVTW